MGTSLLDLLTTELKHELKAVNKLSDDIFSKLILSQVRKQQFKDLFKGQSLNKSDFSSLIDCIERISF